MDDAFQQRHQVGRPPPGADRAGLAEDVDPIAHPAQRLHDLDGIRLLVQSKSGKRKRHGQRRLQIERERRRHGPVQRATRRRSQRVQQQALGCQAPAPPFSRPSTISFRIRLTTGQRKLRRPDPDAPPH